MRVVDENDVELTQDKLDAITDDDGYFEERFIILQHHDATDFVEQKSHVKITVNFADGTHVTLEDKDNQWPSEYFDKPYGDFKCVGKYAGKTFDSQVRSRTRHMTKVSGSRSITHIQRSSASSPQSKPNSSNRRYKMPLLNSRSWLTPMPQSTSSRFPWRTS